MAAKKRRSTPNIMEELFEGKTPAKEESPEEEPETVHSTKDNEQPEPEAPEAEAEEQPKKPKRRSARSILSGLQEEPAKSKATYYLSESILVDLEKVYQRFRKAAGPNKSRISKSLIVEAALRLSMEDEEALALELAKLIKGE